MLGSTPWSCMIAVWLWLIGLSFFIREEFLHIDYIGSVRRALHSIWFIIVTSSLIAASFHAAFFGSKAFLTQCISRSSFFHSFQFLRFLFGDISISLASYPLTEDVVNCGRCFGLPLICDLHKRMHPLNNFFLLGRLWQSNILEKRGICLALELLLRLAGLVNELCEIVSALFGHVN